MGSSLFEQAYYTWDKSDAVRYGAGWGVHVSSDKDEMFTEECIALANGVSEGKMETVGEYLLYSEKWRCFAAVGVSLRPEGDEVHRKNLLCHLFVPVVHSIPLDPAAYLLRYPFDLPEDRKDTLQQIQIEREKYNYRDILQRFGLVSGETGTYRTAVLLKKLYDGLLARQMPLRWNLERGGTEGEDYGRKIKEFVYLLHLWVPGVEESQIREYRSRLTFCVNTSGEGKGVGLLFTENAEDDSLSALEKYGFTDAGEWKFFICLAEKAQESSDCLSAFVRELQSVFTGPLNALDKLLFAYHRKRMNEGEPVTESEVLGVMSRLETKAETDPWYRKLFLDFLMQADLKKSLKIANYWATMFNFMKQELLSDEEKVQVVTKLFISASRESSVNMASRMPEELKTDVLRNAYEIKKDEIRREFDSLDVRTVERFCETAERYQLYWDIPEVGEKMFLKASQLYEEDGSDKSVRERISSTMERYDKERWKEELEDFYSYRERLSGYYLSWLQGHADTVEEAYVPFCYEQMLTCAEKQGEAVDELQLEQAERELRENAVTAIPKDAMDRYQALAEERINSRLSREIASLRPGDLSGLLSIAPDQLRGRCLKLWSEKAGNLLQTAAPLQLEDFKRLVIYIGKICQPFLHDDMGAGGGLARLSQAMNFFVIQNIKKEYAVWYCFYEQKRDFYWNYARLCDAFPVFFDMYGQPEGRECIDYLLDGLPYREKLYQLYEAFRQNRYIREEEIRGAFSGSDQNEKKQFLEAVEAAAEAEGIRGAYSSADYVRFVQAKLNQNGKDVYEVFEIIRRNPQIKRWVMDGLESERTKETDLIREQLKELGNIDNLFEQKEWSLIDLAAAIRAYNNQKKVGMEDREFYFKIDAQMRRTLKEIEESREEYEDLSQKFYGKVINELKNVKKGEKPVEEKPLSDSEAQGFIGQDRMRGGLKAPKTVDTKYPEITGINGSESAAMIKEDRISPPVPFKREPNHDVKNVKIIEDKREEAYSKYDW